MTGQATIVWTRNDTVANAANVFARAWAVAAPVALPAAPAAAPTLAVTGVDDDQAALMLGIGAIALLAGAVTLVVRRRRLNSL